MGLKNKSPEKLFYKISEVAEMFEVNISTIRYWEKKFNILKPKKNNFGDPKMAVVAPKSESSCCQIPNPQVRSDFAIVTAMSYPQFSLIYPYE